MEKKNKTWVDRWVNGYVWGILFFSFFSIGPLFDDKLGLIEKFLFFVVFSFLGLITIYLYLKNADKLNTPFFIEKEKTVEDYFNSKINRAFVFLKSKSSIVLVYLKPKLDFILKLLLKLTSISFKVLIFFGALWGFYSLFVGLKEMNPTHLLLFVIAVILLLK